MLDQSFSWLKRKYDWASKREYEARRIKQHDTQAAVVDSLSIVIGSLFGNKDYESNLLKPYDEAIGVIKQELSDNDVSIDGVDTTQWWKGSDKDGDNI